MSEQSESVSNRKSKRAAAYGLSASVAIGLAVLTIIEYFAALVTSSAIILFLIALVKGYLVVVFFMHVSRLWKPEGEH
jgi:caa(3)-type oxidase subunit IV